MMYIIRSSHKKIWVEREMSILFGLKFASVIAPGEAFFQIYVPVFDIDILLAFFS